MIKGWIKIAVATPKTVVADCEYNGSEILRQVEEAEKIGVKMIVFPELCITGYTCGDLFLQDTLLEAAKQQLLHLMQKTEKTELVIVVGLPYLQNGRLYNVAAVIQKGKLLGLVPKKNIPNYGEFQEARYFAQGIEECEWTSFYGKNVPFGIRQLYVCKDEEDFVFGVEICEDLWVACSPSVAHAKAGATLIANLSASPQLIGKAAHRSMLIAAQSAKLVCAYIYADAGIGESTTDLVFGGHNFIAENGSILAESEKWKPGMICMEVDLQKIKNERRKLCYQQEAASTYWRNTFSFANQTPADEGVIRKIEKMPFLPAEKTIRAKACREVLSIQTAGLCKRLEHLCCKTVVIGISGGLDSTLALLVTYQAFLRLQIPVENIIAVMMPCFGTSERTYQNAKKMLAQLHVTAKEIPIAEAVTAHLQQLGHDLQKKDATYENAQARERTQILMDLANQLNGFVIGTGDLSELALGYATYNGDHMSMYGVNASVPKTLVRELVRYWAQEAESESLREVLLDIVDTPVSPELLPGKQGEIVQKTEDIVGPYLLHDFFLYYSLRYGFSPSKVYQMAKHAFMEDYTAEELLRWMKVFYQRFFAQQFKRSCLPDGPKVTSVTLSPRGDFRMPSDACAKLWLQEIENLQRKNH